MCPQHWRELPAELQQAIHAARKASDPFAVQAAITAAVDWSNTPAQYRETA